MENNLSKEELTIVNSPEWKAGQEFLERCNVTDDDERFTRFYDFIAGWNKSTELNHASFVALVEGEIKRLDRSRSIDEGIYTTYKRIAVTEALTDLLTKIK